MKFYWRIFTAALLVPFLLTAQTGTPAPDRRLSEIQGKQRRGEPVSDEERRYVQGVMAKRREEYAKAHPPQDYTGLVPLTDLGKGTYKGEQGGLYPEGENAPPSAHLKAGLELARRIAPLNQEGQRSEDGKIVLLTIGMSNTTQETQAFQKRAVADPELDPRLVIVDGAQGGQTATITANPQSNFWKVVDQRLSEARITVKQVQVVWLKQANAGPTQPFPEEVKKLESDLAGTLRNLSDRFLNLKIAYLSSRIYAGYASTPLNPEPHAYESAFAVKWLIADQTSGKPELNYDAAKGQVRAPWLGWGPYLWADGRKGRKDGRVWLPEDLGPDGTHPSMQGREKVAKLLLDFFKEDATSKTWFVSRGTQPRTGKSSTP
jgi:lysophospholipase L1-like esterase